MDTEDNKLDLASLGALDFTPDWAKKDAGVTIGKFKPERAERSETVRTDKGDRKNLGDRTMKSRPRKGFGDRRQRVEERVSPLDAEIKILPAPQALGTIIRKIQNDTHAYKMKDLAYFFLQNPQSVLLKVTLRKTDGGAGTAASLPNGGLAFYQCKACGFVAMSEESLAEHILTSHLAEYYDAREVECEPPKGNFNCVARCGLSGVLLGPPNIHEFTGVVREMIRTRYPEMSEEQYRAHIEMVRDASAIDEWRKLATKKTVFVRKGDGGEEPGAVEAMTQLSREQAEGEFRRTILPSLIGRPKHLMITADMAMKSPVKSLVWAAKDAVDAERRMPYNMIFALHGAFRHRKLNFFRVNDSHGPEFVTSLTLKEFDAEHAVPELAAMAKFIAEHPCSAKSDLPAGENVEKQLNWLVSTGHVVAFTNGVFSAVEKFPKYGPQWRKKTRTEDGGQAAAEGEAVVAKAEESVEEVKDESTDKLA